MHPDIDSTKEVEILRPLMQDLKLLFQPINISVSPARYSNTACYTNLRCCIFLGRFVSLSCLVTVERWTAFEMWWHTRRNQNTFFRRNGRVHLNRQGRQFSRLLAAEVCASAVVMLDIPCSEVVWRVLATHCIRQFPLHFPSRASTCAITFQLDSTNAWSCRLRSGLNELHVMHFSVQPVLHNSRHFFQWQRASLCAWSPWRDVMHREHNACNRGGQENDDQTPQEFQTHSLTFRHRASSI